MSRVERNSPEGENKQFNLNILVELKGNTFYKQNTLGILKEWSPEGYFKWLKTKLPENYQVFIKIHTHVLEGDEMCEIGTFLDNKKITRN